MVGRHRSEDGRAERYGSDGRGTVWIGASKNRPCDIDVVLVRAVCVEVGRDERLVVEDRRVVVLGHDIRALAGRNLIGGWRRIAWRDCVIEGSERAGLGCGYQ